MKISVHQSSQCSFLPSNFFLSSKAGGRTWMVGVSILKVHGYFQFHVYRHRMQPTFTASYFLEGGFACYCKMAALTIIVCAHWSLCLPPLSKSDKRLIGGQGKQTDLTS